MTREVIKTMFQHHVRQREEERQKWLLSERSMYCVNIVGTAQCSRARAGGRCCKRTQHDSEGLERERERVVVVVVVMRRLHRSIFQIPWKFYEWFKSVKKKELLNNQNKQQHPAMIVKDEYFKSTF